MPKLPLVIRLMQYSSWNGVMALAVAWPVVGIIAFNLLPSQQSPLSQQQVSRIQIHPGVRAQNDALKSFLQDLSEKTASEKIEGAYDAALKTHEIGFPSIVKDREI
jgi:hypothetical protein